MIERYAKPGDFIQIMRDGGSYYGTLVEINMPWLAMRDADDGQLAVIWCKEGYTFLFGPQCRKNYEEANARQAKAKGAMGMLERALTNASQQ